MSNNQTFEITTPVGRLVGGHPMEMRPVIDEATNQQKTTAGGEPRVEGYIGVAIPKGTEAHWNQTEWGAKIYHAAAAGWPNGEYNSAAFAWKVTDGDSQVPNRRGKKPCEREGWPGHWVLHMSTGIPIKCYHKGRYDPTQQIQNKGEIKPGDYCRVVLTARANAPSQSPGVYLNPQLFELTQPGIEIVLDSGPSAADTFGNSDAQLPAGAQVDPNIPPAGAAAGAPAGAMPPPAQPAGQTPPPGPGAATGPTPPPTQNVTPAPDILNGGQTPPPPGAAATPAPPAQPVEASYNYNGQIFTASQLRAAGWTDEQIQSLPPA